MVGRDEAEITGRELLEILENHRSDFRLLILELLHLFILLERENLLSAVSTNALNTSHLRAAEATTTFVRASMQDYSPRELLDSSDPNIVALLDQPLRVDTSILYKIDPLAILQDLIARLQQPNEGRPDITRISAFLGLRVFEEIPVLVIEVSSPSVQVEEADGELDPDLELDEREDAWLAKHHLYVTKDNVVVISIASILSQLKTVTTWTNVKDIQDIIDKNNIKKYRISDLNLKRTRYLPEPNAQSKLLSIPDVLTIIRTPRIKNKLAD